MRHHVFRLFKDGAGVEKRLKVENVVVAGGRWPHGIPPGAREPGGCCVLCSYAAPSSPPIQGENSAHTKETDTDRMQQRSMGAALKQFEVQRGRNDLRPDFTDGLRGLVTIGAGGVISYWCTEASAGNANSLLVLAWSRPTSAPRVGCRASQCLVWRTSQTNLASRTGPSLSRT